MNIRMPKGETIREWINGAAAKETARWIRANQLRQVTAALLLTCESSTDVKVVKALGEYKAVLSVVNLFEGGIPDGDEEAAQ